MAPKPVLWRNSSLNSRMSTTQKSSDWLHSQKYASSAKILVARRPSNGASGHPRARKTTGKRVTLESSSNHAKFTAVRAGHFLIARLPSSAKQLARDHHTDGNAERPVPRGNNQKGSAHRDHGRVQHERS